SAVGRGCTRFSHTLGGARRGLAPVPGLPPRIGPVAPARPRRGAPPAGGWATASPRELRLPVARDGASLPGGGGALHRAPPAPDRPVVSVEEAYLAVILRRTR